MSLPHHWKDILFVVIVVGFWVCFGLCMYFREKIKKCRRRRRMDSTRGEAAPGETEGEEAAPGETEGEEAARGEAEGRDGSSCEDLPVEEIEMVNVSSNNVTEGRRNL